jgi:hypothetical protein
LSPWLINLCTMTVHQYIANPASVISKYAT